MHHASPTMHHASCFMHHACPLGCRRSQRALPRLGAGAGAATRSAGRPLDACLPAHIAGSRTPNPDSLSCVDAQQPACPAVADPQVRLLRRHPHLLLHRPRPPAPAPAPAQRLASLCRQPSKQAQVRRLAPDPAGRRSPRYDVQRPSILLLLLVSSSSSSMSILPAATTCAMLYCRRGVLATRPHTPRRAAPRRFARPASMEPHADRPPADPPRDDE